MGVRVTVGCNGMLGAPVPSPENDVATLRGCGKPDDEREWPFNREIAASGAGDTPRFASAPRPDEELARGETREDGAMLESGDGVVGGVEEVEMCVWKREESLRERVAVKMALRYA